jgi:hypothetical protein
LSLANRKKSSNGRCSVLEFSLWLDFFPVANRSVQVSGRRAPARIDLPGVSHTPRARSHYVSPHRDIVWNQIGVDFNTLAMKWTDAPRRRDAPGRAIDTSPRRIASSTPLARPTHCREPAPLTRKGGKLIWASQSGATAGASLSHWRGSGSAPCVLDRVTVTADRSVVAGRPCYLH